MIMCSVKNCYQELDRFDTLFCKTCRDAWRSFTEKQKFDFDTTDEVINKALKYFQTNG